RWEQVQAVTGIEDERLALLRQAAALQNTPPPLRFSLRTRVYRDVPLRKGFTEGRYVGSPEGFSGRLDFSVHGRFHGGVLVAKEPGETSPADCLRFTLSAERIGPLAQITAGDFTVASGQGVLLRRGGSFARSGGVSDALQSRGNRISPGLRSSGPVVRGIAASGGARSVTMSVFAGRALLDGKIDSVSGMLSSIDESGLHRTENERGKRDAAFEDLAGAYASWATETNGISVRIGFTGYIARFSHRLNALSPWSFGGSRASAFGVDAVVAGDRWSISWELGRVRNGRLGGKGAFHARPSEGFRVMMVYRDFPADFAAPHVGPLGGQGNTTQNERGAFFECSYRFSGRLSLRAWWDLSHSPGPTYSIGVPSSSTERAFEACWRASENAELFINGYEKNVDAEYAVTDGSGRVDRPLVRRISRSVRVDFRRLPSRGVGFRVRAEYRTITNAGVPAPTEDGFLLLTDIVAAPLHDFSLEGRIAVHRTDSWEARLSAFESDLPGAGSSHPLSGEGLRAYVLLRWSASKWCTISSKAGWTILDGERTLGSGDDQVRGDTVARYSLQADIKL
ncbi:MAG: hypothetical protein QHI48_02250, partial [Bacteroidota bacterium]|nr:hypothetical protein [Bacteroidota bacterium]